MLTTRVPRSTQQARLLPTLLLVLTVFGPISMDLYLPVLPALTAELGAVTSTAQLTITACLLGLALGQLIAGPVSDRFGRLNPLRVGVIAFIVTSVLCAVSPSIELLIVARFAQGLAGGVGIVIAQAAGRDLFSGDALIRFYGRLTVLGGLAAIIGPLMGGQLAMVTDWRGLFLFLAGIGALILIASLVVFRETLAPEQRTGGGSVQISRDYRTLLSDRSFVGAVLVQAFAYAALFAYLAGATFVLQGIYALSPQQYALAFGLNSAGFMACGHLAGRSASRWSVIGTLVVGLAMSALGATGLLVSGLTQPDLIVVLLSLLIMASGVAVITPPATTLALAGYPHIAGTASSLLGMARFALGAISAPLVGLAGDAAMLPLGIVTVAAVALAVAAFAVFSARPTDRDEPASPGRPAENDHTDHPHHPHHTEGVPACAE